MSDNSGDGKTTLKLNAPRSIVLKKTVEEGAIKQSFSHGRTKSVVVEVLKKKTFAKTSRLGEDEASHRRADQARALDKERAGEDSAQANKPKHVLRSLTPEEVERERLLKEQEQSRIAEENRLADEARKAEEALKAEAERKAEEERKAAEPTLEPVPPVVVAESAPPPVAEPVPPPVAVADMVVHADPEPEVVILSTPIEAVAPMSVAFAQAEEQSRREKAKQDKPKEAGKDDQNRGGKTEHKHKPKPNEQRDNKPRDGMRSASPSNKSQTVAKDENKSSRPARPELATVQNTGENQGQLLRPVAKDLGGEGEDGKGKKANTRAQREDLARRKVEDLVAQRLSQSDSLREQKRQDDARRALPPPVAPPAPAPAATTAATTDTERGRAKPPAAAYKATGKGGWKKGGDDGPEDNDDGMPFKRRGRMKPRNDRRVQHVVQQQGPVVREVIVPDVISVGELASRMAVKSSEVIRLLMVQGMLVTINQLIDQDTAVLVVEEMGHKAKAVSEAAAIDAELAEKVDIEDDLLVRAPVVTVMGHVDHGKTSLLDAIRKTDVTLHEFGGITQHIGAYQVVMRSGAKITFLDTPGHAAFTAMRARGAQATDIVVLVVAADDGVMPQTVEAVNHAKAAKVPIVVAINKMDKPDANPDRIMQQLSEFGLVPEEWGGDTIYARVSAKSGLGMEALEEMILVQSEVLDLKANAKKAARGVIVEARLDKGRGAVGTCLVQNGTLKVGDIFVVGGEWGKIRGLLNDKGEAVKEAPPSMPVEIVGLSGVPHAGDDLIVVPDERRAREIAVFRSNKSKEQEQAKQGHANLNDIFSQIKQGELDEVKVLIKGDVQGSVEAVAEALGKITHEKVRVAVIHTGVGGINESDVMLASASNAIVIGFNVRADAKARTLAKRDDLDIRFYNIIYDLIDDVTKAMEGKLQPTMQELIVGHAQIRDVFRISKVGNVAGCMVIDGVARRSCKVRLLRDNVVIHDGTLSALKRYKDDAKEVREGMECGISLDKFNDVKAGDVVEFYTQEEVKQTISS